MQSPQAEMWDALDSVTSHSGPWMSPTYFLGKVSLLYCLLAARELLTPQHVPEGAQEPSPLALPLPIALVALLGATGSALALDHTYYEQGCQVSGSTSLRI